MTDRDRSGKVTGSSAARGAAGRLARVVGIVTGACRTRVGVWSRAARGEERRLRDSHRLLDRVAKRAGLAAGELRSKAFRHTYCAARLQTLDQGAPVSDDAP